MNISDSIEKELERFSDEKGRIECRKAMAISHRLGVNPRVVGKEASSLGFRISDCELAQFGRKSIGEPDEKVLAELKKYLNNKGKITCKNAWKVAEKFGMYKVRSTIKNSDIDVVYCQLGCFREKKRPRLKIRTKTWIENKGKGIVFGKGKLEILKLIDAHGSISSVAKILNLNYKKVWNHIKTLERNMSKKYVISEKGRKIGGSKLTDEAYELIKKYEQLQHEIEEFANKRFRELFYEDRKYREYK